MVEALVEALVEVADQRGDGERTAWPYLGCFGSDETETERIAREYSFDGHPAGDSPALGRGPSPTKAER